MIILASTIMISFILAGFYGIAMTSFGMVCTPSFLVAVNIFGGITT